MSESIHAALGVAAEHATSRVPVAAPGDRVGDVRAGLAGATFDCADDVAVLDGTRIAGLVPIERLLAAEAGALVGDVMDADPPAVAPGANEEAAAWKMVAHGESSLAVVDADERFLGLIPPHRMLAVLLEAHDEDLARLGGYLRGTSEARGAAEEAVGLRLRHRLPWLLIGLVGAMASAVIVAAFERQLDKNVLLAFFVPGIVYMADAVGTQTEAVLIRGLSVGVAIRGVVRRELASGLIVGVAIGGTFLLFVLAVWGDLAVAASVGLALVASCSIATVIAMLLPWLFQRLGSDPAFGSGPLATVIQDLLSISIYLLLATALVP